MQAGLTGGPGVAATSQEIHFLAGGSDHAVWENTASGWASLGGNVVGGAAAAALN